MIVRRDYMTAAMQNEIGRIAIDMKIAIVGQQREFKPAGVLTVMAPTPEISFVELRVTSI